MSPPIQKLKSVPACIWAWLWIAVLCLFDVALGGSLRHTLYYAIPVALSARQGLNWSFVTAGLATLGAWLGGTIPSPGLHDPAWVEGLWAFFKLSTIAVCARLFVKRWR